MTIEILSVEYPKHESLQKYCQNKKVFLCGGEDEYSPEVFQIYTTAFALNYLQ